MAGWLAALAAASCLALSMFWVLNQKFTPMRTRQMVMAVQAFLSIEFSVLPFFDLGMGARGRDRSYPRGGILRCV